MSQPICNPYGTVDPLLDLTTSGITHTCDKNAFGACSTFLDFLTPRYFQAKDRVPPSIDFNYLLVSIRNRTIDLSIKGPEDRVLSQKILKIDDLVATDYLPSQFCERFLGLDGSHSGLRMQKLIHIMQISVGMKSEGGFRLLFILGFLALLSVSLVSNLIG